MIRLQNISFQYDSQSAPILKIADFSVKKGEKIFLFGPSGTGKTTLLEILAGVLSPQEGLVEMNGTLLNQKNQNERDLWRAIHIGYIFQSLNLIPYLSVSENIQLPCFLSSERKAKVLSKYPDLQSATLELTQKLGIDTLLDRPVRNLSVGQQQRVAVARALIGHPEIILADEPTSALDMDHREKFLNLLFELCREMQITVVFVSHDRSIQNLFDRVVSLESLQTKSELQTSTSEKGPL